jgi:hypothetical protein
MTFGSPIWGYLGAVGTTLIFYLTNEIAKNTIRSCSLSGDCRLIYFGMYSITGSSGSVLTVPVGQAKLVQTKVSEHKQSGSYIPITVEGRDRKLVFEKDGEYFDREMLFKVFSPSDALDSKENRANYRKRIK